METNKCMFMYDWRFVYFLIFVFVGRTEDGTQDLGMRGTCSTTELYSPLRMDSFLLSFPLCPFSPCTAHTSPVPSPWLPRWDSFSISFPWAPLSLALRLVVCPLVLSACNHSDSHPPRGNSLMSGWDGPDTRSHTRACNWVDSAALCADV